MEAAMRSLKPGGVLLFETPDPNNLHVAAQNFYFDPSHNKPLPGAMLVFFAEASGFTQIEVRRLHPYPSELLLPEENNPVAKRFNEYFYGPQDYALIARKPV
jgi:O-antigen chain-terminating methyltransferase